MSNRSVLDGRQLLMLISLCFVLTSCGVSVKPGYIDDDKKAAHEATAQFHALYNDGQYSQMYAQSHQLLRPLVPESVFIKMMEDDREKEFGRFEEVVESKEKFVFGAPVEVRIGCHTKYEKGEATEYFTWMMGGDKPRFVLYKIFHGSLPLDDPGPSPSQTTTRQKF